MLFLDDAEVKKLADAMPDYRGAILTATFAGLRASELSTPCPAPDRARRRSARVEYPSDQRHGGHELQRDRRRSRQHRDDRRLSS